VTAGNFNEAGAGFVGGRGYVPAMAPTTVDAPARGTAGHVVTSELAALLARLGDLTDSAAVVADGPVGDDAADDGRGSTRSRCSNASRPQPRPHRPP